MSKKISVIIPIYNVEKYLVQAMESIVNQDYDNYEIICIDDGSTDSSADILDSYDKYSNVKIIHKNNTGYGNSMNIGMDIATGDYIFILEPDDFVLKNTLSSMMDIVEKEGDLDFVKCDFAFVHGENELEIRPTKVVKRPELYGKVLNRDEVLELYTGYIAHWTSIYRKDFLDRNNIRYNETPGASYQDIGLWFQSLMYAENGYLLDQYFYHYRADNPASSMNNKGKVFCVCEEYDFLENIINKSKEKERVLPYYIKCRLIAVKGTYSRIADKYRESFLLRAGNDFLKIKENGNLQTSKLSKEENELLQQLLQSPQELWKYKKNECIKFGEWVKSIDSFYIYGAGNLGQFILRLLDEEGRNKLKGFIVTFQNGEKRVADKTVFEFESIKNDLNESKIVIGVSDIFINEILETMQENKIMDYFVFRGGIV